MRKLTKIEYMCGFRETTDLEKLEQYRNFLHRLFRVAKIGEISDFIPPGQKENRYVVFIDSNDVLRGMRVSEKETIPLTPGEELQIFDWYCQEHKDSQIEADDSSHE